MGTKVKVVKVGNSLRISIPKPLAEALNIIEGDSLELDVVESKIELKRSRG